MSVALAGRNPAKLDAVRTRTGADLGLVTVDATDGAALRDLTARCRVLDHHRRALPGRTATRWSAACADTGTDYLDLTGEPEFADLVYLKHHARAEATGARLLHACGFDSVPHDLGAQFTVDQLPEGVPLTVRGYVRMHGTFSGGTAASALEIMARWREGRTTHEIRRQVEPEPEGRSVTVATGRVGRDASTGWWVIPLPTIDPLVVAQSARQLPRYGPDFTYSHFLASDSPLATAATLGGIGALAAAAQIPRHAGPWPGCGPRAAARRRPSGTRPGSRSASSARAAARRS